VQCSAVCAIFLL